MSLACAVQHFAVLMWKTNSDKCTCSAAMMSVNMLVITVVSELLLNG